MSDDHDATIVLIDPNVRREGYLAGRRGLRSADNPYPFLTREALAWELGRHDGWRRPLRVVASASPSVD